MSNAYFEGKRALVTGGASGLGRGICESLAARGATVVIADLDGAQAARVAAEIDPGRVTARSLDVTDADAVAATIDAIVTEQGPIDLVFNNAGIAVGGELQEVSPQMLERVIRVNLLGVGYVTHAVYNHMLQRGSGHIVNIGSMYSLMPGVMQSAYAAAKHGVTGLTMSLAAEAQQRGIEVTLVCPGYVDTNLFSAGQYGGKLDAERALEAIPFDLIDVPTAVRKMLDGVAHRRLVVAYPGYVVGGWWLNRISPALFRWYNARELSKIKRAGAGAPA